jgi:hypothetical protein
MTDEDARIRSYLQAQGAKLSPAEVIDKVRAAMEQVRTAALAIPAGRFDERPAPDEWSGNEVMAHVVAAGAHFGGSIGRVLGGVSAEPPEDGRDAAGEPVLPAAVWWERLARDREALFERVLRADPGAHLTAKIEHGTFGALNWRETLLFLRLHDLDHAGQLARIASALA